MPVSYSLALNIHDAHSPASQAFLTGILTAARKLPREVDATFGAAGRMAAEGVRSVPPASVSETGILCVVDNGFYQIDSRTSGAFIEFLLAGKYYRLVTGYAPNVGSSNFDKYPPQSIRPIKMPTALESALGKVVPAPVKAGPATGGGTPSGPILSGDEYVRSPVAVSDNPEARYILAPSGDGDAPYAVMPSLNRDAEYAIVPALR